MQFGLGAVDHQGHGIGMKRQVFVDQAHVPRPYKGHRHAVVQQQRLRLAQGLDAQADLRRINRVRPFAHQPHDHRVVAAMANAGGRQRAIQLNFDALHLFQRARSRRFCTNNAAARMGPTVWELDGPMPILNRSKTLIAIARNSSIAQSRRNNAWWRSCYAQVAQMAASSSFRCAVRRLTPTYPCSPASSPRNGA